MTELHQIDDVAEPSGVGSPTPEAPFHPLNDKSLFHQAFGRALTAELDLIGYPPAPLRSTALAKDLSLGRAQSFKLLNGTSVPAAEGIAALREKGCSIDRLLDCMHQIPEDTDAIDIEIDGNLITAVVQKSPLGDTAGFFATPTETGTYVLRVLTGLQTAPANSIPLSALRFRPSKKHTLALLDDDHSNLKLLTLQLSKTFRVTPFSMGKALLHETNDLRSFSVFVVDWKLYDIDGEVLIAALRQLTKAPIFILTGDTSASTAIVRAMNHPDVHHIGKPADPLILVKRLNDAIAAA